jgi:hypothetical protein
LHCYYNKFHDIVLSTQGRDYPVNPDIPTRRHCYGFDILATYKFGSLVGMIYLMLLCSCIALMNLTFLADSQVKIAVNEFMDMII